MPSKATLQILRNEGWREGENDNPLEFVIPVGYDEAITLDVIKVMQCLREKRGMWYRDIAAALSLDEKYVHLILEILGDKSLTEYGSSPRGSWLTDLGLDILAITEQYLRESTHAH